MSRLAVVLIVLGVLLIALGWPAYAHDAIPTAAQPKGWTYPGGCCSGVDCREVADSAIGEGAKGYTIRRTGELLIYRDSRIKNSPDGQFHWCSVQGKDTGSTICLFVPPRGF